MLEEFYSVEGSTSVLFPQINVSDKKFYETVILNTVRPDKGDPPDSV